MNFSSTLVVTDPDNNDEIKIDLLHARKASLMLRALNHKLRQQIIKIIEENKKVSVTDIYIKLRLEQSVASQHLAILRRIGIVNTDRNGKFIYYTLNYDRIKQLNNFIEQLTN